jgi:hypothetical protein
VNINQLRAVLKAGERLHREAGDADAANGLAAFSHLLDGAESGTVADLVKRIEKARKRKPRSRAAPGRRRASQRGGR